jgi:hypothetical protein
LSSKVNECEPLPGGALAALPLRSLDVSHNLLQALPTVLPCHTLAQLACGGDLYPKP